MKISRRRFLWSSGVALGGTALAMTHANDSEATENQHWFKTRGVILIPRAMESYDWPALAKETGLTTLATHKKPGQVAEFLKTEAAGRFMKDSRQSGLTVEHELHALADFLPRKLFEKNPSMFRMDEKGNRVPDANLCVHSNEALDVVAENATRCTSTLRSDTGRYFYWIDDNRPMCHCPKCRAFSDSDQALILENHILKAIRKSDPRATLAHLAYENTIDAPKQIKPDPGIFLEFAPIERRYDKPFSQRDAKSDEHNILHGRLLDALDANLEWFGRETAQVLEYWLDVARFANWKRENVSELPWHDDVFRNDLATYARRGIRHVTTFAGWVDGDYVKRWGVNPVKSYGSALAQWRIKDGRPMEL